MTSPLHEQGAAVYRHGYRFEAEYIAEIADAAERE
jgi:hypothetical protein